MCRSGFIYFLTSSMSMSFMSVDNRWWPPLWFGRRRRRRTGAALRMQSSHQHSLIAHKYYMKLRERDREREEKRR